MQSTHSNHANLRRAPHGETSRLLVVDDEPLVRRWVERVLSEGGYVVDAVDDGLAAVSLLDRHCYDLVLTDVTMPRLDGLGVLAAVAQHDATLPVVLMTGAPSDGLGQRAAALGAVQVLMKPMPLDAVVEAVGRWVRLGRLQRLSIALRQKLFGDGRQAPSAIHEVEAILRQLSLPQVNAHCAVLASQLVTIGPNALIPHALLLDPELVCNIDGAAERLAIVRALAQHCADLALPMIALDAQTLEAQRALLDAGCSLFHPPMHR